MPTSNVKSHPPETPALSIWALPGLSMSMLLSSLGTSIANVGLPSLQVAFDASFQNVQWIVLSYLLAITTLIVSAGRLGDMFGRRRMLIVGLSLFVFASLLCGLAPSLSFLIAARGLQGLGAALMMSLSMAMIGSAVSPQRTGSAMGLLGTMSAIGTALGPSLGGVLLVWLGWRAIFLASVPLGMVTLFIIWRALPADVLGRTSERFDFAGTFLLAFTLGAYALAMTIGKASFGMESLLLLLAAVFGLIVFLIVERRVAAPLLQLALFRDPHLRSSLLTSVLVSTVILSTLVVGPFYLRRALGLSDAVVGLVMSVGPVLSAITGFVAGRFVDRIGATRIVVSGLSIMGLGALALSELPVLLGLPGYLLAMMVLTPGYQLFQAANNTSVMKDVRPDQRGVVSGLLNLSRNLGLVTGASVMGAMFALGTGVPDIARAPAEAISNGLQFTFLIAASLLGLALVLAILDGRNRALAKPETPEISGPSRSIS